MRCRLDVQRLAPRFWFRSASVVRLATALALITAAVAGGALTGAHADGSATTVAVTIRDSGVVFSPTSVPSGSVTFAVVNRGKAARDFEIGGRKTPRIAAGKTGAVTVQLSQGTIAYSSVGRNRSTRLTGVLDVVDACTNPVASTVNLQLAQAHGGIIVSQSTIPCGTVTFVITNTGTLVDSLQIYGLQQATKGSTPELQPGQTTRLTLRFATKGTVYYQSGDYPPAEPEYGGDYNEEGVLTVV